jgi:hypothetical protein
MSNKQQLNFEPSKNKKQRILEKKQRMLDRKHQEWADIMREKAEMLAQASSTFDANYDGN